MFYPFIKRILPILCLGLIIYGLLFIIFVGIFHITGMMISQQAHELRKISTDDADFADNVRIWVWNHITPKPPYRAGTNVIQPPEISYLVGSGDCSERSLLMTKMLNDEGIQAQTIWGYTSGDSHQSVEYTINGTTRIIDQEQFPDFHKSGDGIMKTEYVYDVYWFIPWRDIVNSKPLQGNKEAKNDTNSKVYLRLT